MLSLKIFGRIIKGLSKFFRSFVTVYPLIYMIELLKTEAENPKTVIDIDKDFKYEDY